MDYLQYKNYLMHYGVEGQKWGVRRYQNADGSLTAEGKAHYGVGEERVNELKNELRTRKNYKKNGKAGLIPLHIIHPLLASGIQAG